MNTFNRRKFLLSTLGSAIASQLIPGQAFAADGESDKLFVQIQIEGGFDVLQSLDPFIQGTSQPGLSLYRDYLDSDVKGEQVIFAPGAHALLPYSSEMIVLNGVSVKNQQNTSHEACRAYFASGAQGLGAHSHLVVEVASIQAPGPFGVIANNRGSFTNLRTNIDVSLTDDMEASQVSADDPRFNLPMTPGGFDPFFNSLNAFISSVNIVNDYNSLLTQASTMFNTNDSKTNWEVRMAAALGSGLSRHAFMNFGGDFVTEPGYGGLDAHSGFQTDHLQKQTKYFERLAGVLKLFKQVPYKQSGKSLFDVTTFFVTNEFSRSPHLVGDGKDHNPETTSGLLIGRGVKGNQVVGKTHLFADSNPVMTSLPIDYSTGKALVASELTDIAALTAANSNVRMMKPENVVASILDIMDIPKEQFANFQSPGVKSIPGLKKS
jgi:hypothetical protein